MRARDVAGLILLVLSLTGGANAPAGSGRYFGQTAPADTPAVFAPGIISLDGRWEQFLLYSPDGNSLTFGVTNADWSQFTLYYMEMKDDGTWTDAVPAPFAGSDGGGLTSCLSPRGDVAFFTASRPTYPPCDIWTSLLDEDGWSEPEKMDPPISSPQDEFEVSMAETGTLYFSSARPGGHGDLDIYRAPIVGGAYPVAENLGPPINTASGDDLPYIAPDESYLIFASDRPGGLGQRDLYITYLMDTTWSAPQHLPVPINSAIWDIYPSVSPDGEYFFLTHRDAWKSKEDSDIYWVRADFIEAIRPDEAP